jgi:hypothetical protein
MRADQKECNDRRGQVKEKLQREIMKLKSRERGKPAAALAGRNVDNRPKPQMHLAEHAAYHCFEYQSLQILLLEIVHAVSSRDVLTGPA